MQLRRMSLLNEFASITLLLLTISHLLDSFIHVSNIYLVCYSWSFVLKNEIGGSKIANPIT